MNIFKYFKFFYDITERKLLIVICMVMTSSGFQGLALAALATVSEQGSSVNGQNMIAKTIYRIIRWVNITQENQVFALLLVIVAVSFGVMSIFRVFNNIYIAKLQNYIYIKIQRQAMKELMNSKYEFFFSNNIGHFNNVMISQLITVASSFKFFTTIIVLALSALPFFAISVSMNPEMAITLGLLLSVMVLPIRWINRKTYEYSILNVKEMAQLNSLMIQILSHFKYLKATFTYRPVLDKLFKATSNLAEITRMQAILASGINELLVPFMIIIICCLVYWQVVIHGVSIISAGFALGLLYMATTRLSAIPVAYQKFVSASGSILAYKQTMENLALYQEQKPDKKCFSADFSGTIEFSNVCFKYASNDSNAVDNISFNIHPYTSVAFVGGSGAGKTTIVNMIAGLLAPQNGKISISGTDYSELDLNSLRKGIGYVTQEPVIFTDTVANNISLFCSGCDINHIRDAARAAHANEFIELLPSGYDTMLGDHGVNISGGQRQRISIAREFLRGTPLLILDEATSSLDSETEQIIQQSIEDLKGKKTLIIIAHRLSTVKNCDKIIVLENGKIVEQGNFQELLDKGGKFKEMVERQSLN